MTGNDGRIVLTWAQKVAEPLPREEEPERGGIPWRIATALVILASAVLIPVAYQVLWPADAHPARRRAVLVPEEQVFDDSEEEAAVAAGAGRETTAGPSMGTNRSTETEENG